MSGDLWGDDIYDYHGKDWMDGFNFIEDVFVFAINAIAIIFMIGLFILPFIFLYFYGVEFVCGLFAFPCGY